MNGYTISCYIALDVKKTDFAFLILKAKQGKDEKKRKEKKKDEDSICKRFLSQISVF